MLLVGSSAHWAQQRKESVSLSICQQKFPKLNNKEKKNEKKKEQNVQELWEITKFYHMCNGRTRKKKQREKGVKELFEAIRTNNFPKLMMNTKP